MLLAVILILPAGVNAANAESVQPRASYYIEAYSGYVYPAGDGEVQVWFTINGTDYMDEIGTLTIYLYESTDNQTWSLVQTYEHADNPGMLDTNDWYHSGHVSYQGVAGNYYNAYIDFWAGKDGGGDSRLYRTGPDRAY